MWEGHDGIYDKLLMSVFILCKTTELYILCKINELYTITCVVLHICDMSTIYI